jgi:hypothetical protein
MAENKFERESDFHISETVEVESPAQDQVSGAPSSVPEAEQQADGSQGEQRPNPAARRILLFESDNATRVYAVKTDQHRYLPVTALLVPLGSEGGTYGGFAQSLKGELPGQVWDRIATQLDPVRSEGIDPASPAVIPLDLSDVETILPNAPAGRPSHAYCLIVATAAGASRPEDLRAAASAIVRQASQAGVAELAVLPLGTGRGPFKDRRGDVASQMVHGIWAALLDLPDTGLREITFATRDDAAYEAAYRKANLLTRNLPQQIWGDQPAEKDLLGIKNEAEALAETLLLRQVTPPLAVGILGGWGSGKSTVMRLMMKRMTQARIARIDRGWPEDGNREQASTRVGHIYQIRFNAWTYAKSNLWASLMQTVFCELNRQLTTEQRLAQVLRSEKGPGWTPLEGGREFQFLYDHFAHLDGSDDLWRELPLAARAALQADSSRNILWRRLRAKHRHTLATLQEKEKEIARLKAEREEAEARRKMAIMRTLGRESQVVAYGLLRRRARAVLGDLYDRVIKKVEEEGQLALAAELQERLAAIASRAEMHAMAPAPFARVMQAATSALQAARDTAPGRGEAPENERRAGELEQTLEHIVDLVRAGESELQPDALVVPVLARIARQSTEALAASKKEIEARKKILLLERAIALAEAASAGAVEILAVLDEMPRLVEAASRTPAGAEVSEQIAVRIAALRAIHERVRMAYREAAQREPLAVEPLLAELEEIQRKVNDALALDSTEVKVEALFDEVRSLGISWKKVRQAAAHYPLQAGAVALAGVAMLFAAGFLLTREALLPALAGVTALVGSLVTLLGPPLKVVAGWGRRVSELAEQYQEEMEDERQRYQALLASRLAQARAEDEKELQDFLDRPVTPEGALPPNPVELRERPAQKNLAALDHRIAQLETEAEELRREAGPAAEYDSLLDFVLARQNEEFYEKQLGLMHQIQCDIEILTSGLALDPQDEPEVVSAKKELFPRGPARVVLYIDDLDRCPPRRVVEVLEAVQLLLNTKLFVVVLGLDTRYITRALEKEYQGILEPGGAPSGLDYIEKILQLPYRVRPIDERHLQAFLRAQMEVVLPDGESPDSRPEAAAGHETGTTRQQGDGTGAAANGEPDDEGSPALPELPPEVIKFQPEDLADLEACCRQLALTPRNVKRLVNVLKLIDVFWFRTGGDLRGRPVKRTVIGLLALSAGYPEIMREAFAQMVITYRDRREADTLEVGRFLSELSLPASWREHHESLLARFHADVDSLYRPSEREDSFFAVTFGALEVRTFNIVRSFSFVGDAVYLGDGSTGRPETNADPPPGNSANPFPGGN